MCEEVKIKVWENEMLGIKFTSIRAGEKCCFVGREVAFSFGWRKRPTKAILDHVDDEDKITVENFLKSLSPSEKEFIQMSQNRTFDFFQDLRGNKKNQILILPPAVYCLALKSRLESIKPFRRWVYNVIEEVRETGSYTLSGKECLSLEEKKEAIKQTIKYDIPEYVFGGNNFERNEIHVLCKDGVEKSKDLVHSMWSKKGGDKSSENTTRARNFTKEIASKSIEDLNRMSQDDLYEYNKYLIHKSRDIVKEFTT